MHAFLKKIATMFGIGFFPKGSGTVATVATLPIAWALNWCGPYIMMIFIILLFPISVLASDAYEKDKGGHDFPEIVIDEVIGFLITMTWLPATWQVYLAGFLLFRILDIFKPFPIGYLDEKVPGGLGVVVDDVAAGIIANIILQILLVKTSWLGVQIA
jgi:phosphatidylglycerophosphatase A